MVEQNKDLTTNDLIEIKASLKELNYSIEELTQAIKQLDSTIKKELRQKSQQPLPQLKETVTAFLEYHINPTYYYQGTSYLQLKAATPMNHTGPSNINNVKDKDIMNQETESIYILGLKKAIQDFKKDI